MPTSTLETAGKMPLPETGTAHAISYLRLGVAANSTRSTGRGGARNRSDRVSHALTAAQIVSLKAAESHAAAIGLPFTRMITMHWQAAGLPLEAMASATGRFTDLMTKAMSRHGSRTTWLWVHENGDNKGGHCHLLAHVPAEHVKRLSALQMGWLRRITGNAYRARVICSRPIGGRLGLEVGNPELHAVNLRAAFGYICKGASQSVLDTNGIDRRHEPGGRIIGKRCGTSQNISAKARRNGATE
ncbi:hypothetical protein [Sneathiella sp.]|uniref:hypothetical protein n=1 Tax=Sneathiella sp. TaxID=1964365 RepID=UPI0035666347